MRKILGYGCSGPDQRRKCIQGPEDKKKGRGGLGARMIEVCVKEDGDQDERFEDVRLQDGHGDMASQDQGDVDDADCECRKKEDLYNI